MTTPATKASPALAARALRLLTYPETVVLLMLPIALAVGGTLSEYFLNARYLLNSSSLYMETGIMALAMTFIIISGNIDLSVASNLCLTGVLGAEMFTKCNVPMVWVILLAPLIGALLGLFNGLLIAWLRLPSLTVTLGTLALYRGLAQVMVGDKSLNHFPDWFIGINDRGVGPFPMPLIIFLVMALVCGIVLAKTTFGRRIYAIGTNEAAARFAGIRVTRYKLIVFTLAGFFSGIASMMMLSRLSSASYKMADGDELAVITAVVLGGTDIFGGRGSIFGTVTALFLLGIVARGMGVADVTAQNQLAVIGTLLVASVILFRLLSNIRRKR